jgi:hypothetical protein
MRMPEPAATEPEVWNDLQPLLDQELSRLPDKYRVAIVLCDLEGKTRKEAARRLGVPEGTLAARVARGRVMLAKRLARHGLTVSGGALGAVLAENVASAVPASVVSSTIKATILFATGQGAVGAISANVAALAEGVLKGMLLTKLKIAVAAFLVIATLGAAVGALTRETLAADPAPAADRSAEHGQDEGNLKETVLALQKRIWEANAKQDVNAMKNLLAGDFAGLDKNGNPFDKGDELQYVSAWCEFDHSIKEARVVLLNHSSAVIIYEVHYQVRRTNSQEVDSKEARQGTAAWAKRNGRWWYVYKESHTVSAEKNRFLKARIGEVGLDIILKEINLEKKPPKD